MKSKHKLMKRIFESQGMQVNFDSFGESVEESIDEERGYMHVDKRGNSARFDTYEEYMAFMRRKAAADREEEEKEFNRMNPDPDALTPKSPEVQKLQAIVDELEDEAKKPDRRCSSGVRWSRDADGRKIPGEKCDGSELFVDGMPAGKYKRAKDALMAAIKAGK